uniref:Uncharacterized protein n=1 Tax=Tanacetum cinerariifolium TaxID=118510 RepID=A0A6L2KVV2_TANCI|nr:hypothetical protein [Tanacetum cinerariifolium]
MTFLFEAPIKKPCASKCLGLVAATLMLLRTKCYGHMEIDPYTKEELGKAAAAASIIAVSVVEMGVMAVDAVVVEAVEVD